MKKLLPLFLISTAGVIGAEPSSCAPTPPASCYSPGECGCRYCLGPAVAQGNAPVRPYTCNGDFVITVAGFYWTAHQDGMQFALESESSIAFLGSIDPQDVAIPIPPTDRTLVDAEFKSPDFKWDWGFKIGLGYNTTCDGWDLGVLWTHYRAKASRTVEAEPEDNHALYAIWSAFRNASGAEGGLIAYEINADWKANIDLVDIELGREYWTSKYLSLRPFVGIRIAYINQDYEIFHKGGAWAHYSVPPQIQDALNNEVDIENDYKSVGLRSGISTNWNLGCGWSIYGNTAFSILYGRFHVKHDEENRAAEAPFAKTKVLESEDNFRSSRGVLDLALGVKWFSLVCDCKYGIAAMLGWEQHIFLGQNQMWRVNRIGLALPTATPANSGENVFQARRGDLDVQGWTLTIQFDF